MKTFLLISVMLLTSLFVESRTVPDVHIRGVDIFQPQTLNVVTIQMVEFDYAALFTINLVLTEAVEPAPTFVEFKENTLEGYSEVVNPPPLDINGKKTILNNYRDVWKFLLTDIAIIPNQLNYNFTSYPSLSYYNYNRQATATSTTSIALKRYPSTKARMC